MQVKQKDVRAVIDVDVTRWTSDQLNALCQRPYDALLTSCGTYGINAAARLIDGTWYGTPNRTTAAFALA